MTWQQLLCKTEDQKLFAFVCTSDYIAVADAIGLPKDKLGACVDSGASSHYFPDRTKSLNYRPLEDRNITTVDGRSLKAVGIGDVHIKLPNGSEQTPALLKNAVYAPGMAFTLILVSWLDEADCSVIF
jgi:hypothetical protein